MPKDTSSPFTPGRPVPIEFFVGRRAELERLERKVASARGGRLEVVFLAGERGIGKSSLASFVRHLSEVDHQMVGLHVFLGGVTSLQETVRRVFDRLLKESVDKTWHRKAMELFGKHVQQVGLFGVNFEFRPPAAHLDRLVYDFTPALRHVVKQLGDERNGLCVILDDTNGLTKLPDFANWLKSVVDKIATSREPLPLCLVLVGLEERRQELINAQPSLARVFDIVDIIAWSVNETMEFYTKAFSEVSIKMETSALDVLTAFAGGLPVLAHEIGDAAFNWDTDGRIDEEEARLAVSTAADIVGRKHLEPQVFQAIRSERYRSILRKLAMEPFGFRFTRRDVLKHLSKDEVRVYDNFINRMRRLQIVTRDIEAGPGAYQFTTLLHSLYFYMEATRAREARVSR